MGWALRNFSPIEPGETDVFGFDFINNIGDAGITHAAVSCVVKTGGLSDSTPSNRIGQVQTQGTQILFTVSGCLDGVDYIMTATATLSDGRVLSQWAVVKCRQAPSIQ